MRILWVALTIAGMAAAPAIYLHRTAPRRARTSALEELLRRENRDLGSLPDGEKREVEALFWELFPGRRYGGRPVGFEWPCWVARLHPNDPGSPVAIAAVGPGLYATGQEGIFIGLVDADGNPVWGSESRTGRWMTVERVDWLTPPEIGVPCIRFEHDCSFTYFAVRDQGVGLVRFESKDHQPSRNYYCRSGVYTVGPAPTERTAEEWEGLLFSSDPPDVLQALVWLSGLQPKPSRRPLPTPNADDRNSDLFERVIGRGEVIRRIRELRESRNPWIREYARMAETPTYFSD